MLVVDDEPQIRRALATNLRARGYDVDLAASGEEALVLAAERHPDVVILDLGLPGIDGIEATREILRVDAKAVVVMCSALGQEALVMEAIEAGAMDFIVKPPRAEDVLAVVKKVLGEA